MLLLFFLIYFAFFSKPFPISFLLHCITRKLPLSIPGDWQWREVITDGEVEDTTPQHGIDNTDYRKRNSERLARQMRREKCLFFLLQSSIRKLKTNKQHT